MRIQKTLAPLLGGDTLKTYTITQLSKHETKQLKKITPNNITFNFIFQFNPVCIEFDLTRTSILSLLYTLCTVCIKEIKIYYLNFLSRHISKSIGKRNQNKLLTKKSK